jgi:hypothetical protein
MGRTLLYNKGLICATQISETYNYGRLLIKKYQLLPEAASYIPAHFDMDTATLNQVRVPDSGDSAHFAANITYHKQVLWDSFFHITKAVFRDTQLDVQGNYIRGGPNSYCFNFHIQTDGVSCSIMLVKFEKKDGRFKGRVAILKDPYIDEVVDPLSLYMHYEPKPH